MKPKTDHERLLADVLSSESDSAFSACVLAETLRGVRRQHRMRQVRHYGVAVATILVATLIASHFLHRPIAPTVANKTQTSGYQLVATTPLTASQITESRFFSPDQAVVAGNVSLVQTTTGGFAEIGDDELLSLAAPNVVALVRRGPHEAELVFVSAPPQDSSMQAN